MLHDVPRTARLGGYTFPTRHDYLTHRAERAAVDELEPPAVVAIQRDWHMRGQNGCIFAMHAARKLNARQWRYEVQPRVGDARRVGRMVAAAVDDPENQILSLLFPALERLDDVYELLWLARLAGFYQVAEADGRSGLVCLRYPVGDAESWVVGFAPLTTLPATRRAPFAELAIRTKVKTRPLHSDLNGDMTQAHLADVDLGLSLSVVTSLISKSKQRTTRILGGDANRSAAIGAKARVTYDLSARSCSVPN